MKSEIYHKMRRLIAKLIQGTEWEGHVYLVGGCVRDEIMQRKIHDIDLAVDLPNGGIRFAMWLYHQRYTASKRTPLLFIHFGTAKVRLRKFPRNIIDIVQTRKTRYTYEENPHPEDNYGNLVEDAGCRDLTINSLFINISTGQLVDPTGRGMHDIENQIIRTPNLPDISLRDNAMHILRCIRFAVRFGWTLEPKLIEAMKRNVDIMAEATTRRMTNELESILSLRHKDKAIALIRKVGAWPYVEPYIQIAKDNLKAEKARLQKASTKEPPKEQPKETKKSKAKQRRRRKKVTKGYKRANKGSRKEIEE